MTERKQKLDDDAIESAVRSFLHASLGQPGDEVDQLRERNLRYYNAKAEDDLAPPDIDDRSSFVATDVADTVEWMLPQIIRLFVASGKAVEFEPRRPEDEAQADMATEYINWLFYVRNDGQEVVYDWFKDALLQKVGFVKVWAQEVSEDERRQFAGLTQEQAAMLIEDGWQVDGEAAVDEMGALHLSVIREQQKIEIKVAAVMPSEMRVDVNAQWGAEPAAIAHVYQRRRFELEQDGFDLSEVSDSNGRWDSRGELGESSEQRSDSHESHRMVEVAETYIKLDRDGDGVAEWLKVETIDNKLAIRDGEPSIEQVDDHPFVWICPIPRPHGFFGDCPADLAIQPQKARTSIIRAIEDNIYLTVNQRTYVNTDAEVDVDDLLNIRPGGIVRGRGVPSNAIQPLVQPALGAPAYQFNEWLENWKENRTGFTRYSQGTDANALNKTATGVSIITQKADMRMELIARNFAVGFRQLFAKMLKLAVSHQNQEEMVRVNGQFVGINPSEFKNQYTLKINVGLGTGTKEQTMQRVMALLQMQMQAGLPAGVVRPEHIAESIRLAVEANEFKQPERFVDEAPQNAPNPQQMQQMQQQLEQLSQENGQLKQQNESKQGELEIKRAELELKQAELAGKQWEADQRVALDHANSQRADMALEQPQVVAELQAQVETLTQAVQMLFEQLGGEPQELEAPVFEAGEQEQMQPLEPMQPGDGIDDSTPFEGPSQFDPGELQ